MKTFIFFILLILLGGLSEAQNSWNQKTNFGGLGRRMATGFSIGTKGYIGLGNYYNGSGWTPLSDFWEWDQSTNAWTQIANYGGGAKSESVGLSIGTKGYAGPGSYANDFWEYNPGTNTWTQKANFAGVIRAYASGFSIGSKLYIGTGSDNMGKYLQDFWEWDQSTNIWTQKANFGGTARSEGVGFSIGSKGYIGTGRDISGPRNDFWEYDPANNSWTQKSSFGTVGRVFATGFSIGNKGFIAVGSGFKDVWQWDQATNVWKKISDYPGSGTQGSGFSIGTHGYVGLGSSSVAPNNAVDFWELTVCDLNTAGTSNTICIGENITLNSPYSPSTNNQMYSWSPALGLSNTTIASPVASPTQNTTYTLTIQDTTSHCAATVTFTVAITKPTISIGVPYNMCAAQNITLCASGGTSYSWSTGETTNCILTNSNTVKTYMVTGWDNYGCPSSNAVTVNCNLTGSCQVNNAGFESGNTSGWICKNGYYGAGASCPTVTCPRFKTIYTGTSILNPGGINAPLTSATDRHVIVKGNGKDPNSNNVVPVVAPGGVYSFRLGNNAVGGSTATGSPGGSYGQVEAIRLNFPVTTQNQFFTYRYAFFVQNGGHPFAEQASFEVVALDQNDSIIPCGHNLVIAGNTTCIDTTGFKNGINGYIYKNWTDASLDLSGYIGQNVSIEFRTTDCYPATTPTGSTTCGGSICTYCVNGSCCTFPAGSPTCTPPPSCTFLSGTHSAYVYIDAYCASNVEVNSATICLGDSTALTASGGGPYSWSTGATTSFISVAPTSTATYSVTVGSGSCSAMATSTVSVVSILTPTISGPSSICFGNAVTLTASGGNNIYSWSTGAKSQSIIVAPTSSASYSVIATSGACSDTAAASITVNLLPPVTLSLNPDTVCTSLGPYALTGGLPNGGVYTGTGVNSNNFNPSTAGAGLHNIIYTYTDGNNCVNSDTSRIYVYLCTGMETFLNNESISIIPNPSTGIFTIQSPAQISQIEIITLFGEKVYVRQITPTTIRSNKLEIDLSNAPNGIYFIQLTSEQGIITKKLIKQ